MIDFDRKECNSIKYFALKLSTNINETWRFINEKMMMLAKISLKSIVYDMIDVFCFLTEEVKMIHDKSDIIKCYMCLNLTDTGNCSCFFNFICKSDCNIKESEPRNSIFEILKQSKVAERLDVSDTFCSQFYIRGKNVKKQMQLYEIENISNAIICTIAVNPKEHFEKFKNRILYKKRKDMRRDTKGINFESDAERIAILKEPDGQRNKKQFVQKRLQVTNTEMKMTSVNKIQFASLNDKRYYFLDGIVSLPYGHLLL